jgi:hypothetical protein
MSVARVRHGEFAVAPSIAMAIERPQWRRPSFS